MSLPWTSKNGPSITVFDATETEIKNPTTQELIVAQAMVRVRAQVYGAKQITAWENMNYQDQQANLVAARYAIRIAHGETPPFYRLAGFQEPKPLTKGETNG